MTSTTFFYAQLLIPFSIFIPKIRNDCESCNDHSAITILVVIAKNNNNIQKSQSVNIVELATIQFNIVELATIQFQYFH